MRRLALPLALLALAAGCGGSKSSGPVSSTTTAPTTTAAPSTSVARDEILLIVYRSNGVELAAARVSVPRTPALARAAP